MEHLHQHAHAHAHHRTRRDGHMMQVRGSPSLTAPTERTKVLVPRASCTNDSDPGCKKPYSVPTLPVVLAVVIPIVIAAAVLIFLHRRHLRKLKEEDAKDKYKSLDFGMDPAVVGKGKKGKKGPEMTLTETEKSLRQGRGLSLDMSAGSPYILPAGLHGSRESFHSLSRSTQDPHDPYRPVTFIKDNASIHSGNRGGAYRHDSSSTYTGSSGGTDRHRMNDGLLRNAQRMSQSLPPRGQSMSPESNPIPEIRYPEPVATPLSPLNPAVERQLPSPPPPPPPPPPPAPLQAGNTSLPTQSVEQPLPAQTMPSSPPRAPARVQSQSADLHMNANTTSFMSDSSYGDGFKVTPPSPPREHRPPPIDTGLVAPEPQRPQNEPVGLGVEDIGYDARRLSMSLRPLPPDDPNDNPEQRANRIRSFYKEYFDDSRPEPTGGMYNDYYEDYGSEYLDGAIFDPQTGNFVVAQAPYAQPVTRRAMTPPPRAPPRFRSGSNPHGPGPRGAHMSGSSMASSGRFMPPPRGMSSMSGRIPGPRRPLPPPSNLQSLPTPHMLKEDSMVFNPIDFAPPVSIRELQNGRRPDSPLGAPRPYSPSVRPHTPLASSFDDLAVMPSPHMLRRSGTFTALDFAPPPRFRDPGSNASDAGSIRSNRSGMSAAGHYAIRNGANRVSRIPKGVVGTKDDILTSLRPKMDLVAPA
ncbi:hypothetical protein EJ04DRAFT_162554 [Polyplosphaeria fusca]|uniref:Uncharacterized protein n=1 Tax=Polyplosphaeria fusca TaxID=682080 RepID=A0A9P4V8K3_9PLEO|nr:hypothetical protein EJ04DRAFT_162554 [Polyplosphaeria fusca]